MNSVEYNLKGDLAKEKINDSLMQSISMVNVRARWEMPAHINSVCSPMRVGKYKTNIQNGSIRNASGKPKDNILAVNQVSDKQESGNVKMTLKQTLTLNDLNVQFPKGKLIGVIGPIGAGKSSLLQALLYELPLESGSISINGSLSYASQVPWIFAASVKQNILFGQEYDRDRYNAVVQACALTRDFQQFEDADQTIVGERGASLSGGQKARIK